MTTIHTALAAVMDDCKAVAKRDRNEHQRFLFRGIDAVVNAVGPVLRKHHVTVRPVVQSVTYDHVQTSGGKPATACRVVVDYVFGAEDGSELTATVAAEAWDNGDKAAPKAMSVAFRTALLQTLALPTDEPDPDTQTYERAPASPQQAQRQQAKRETRDLVGHATTPKQDTGEAMKPGTQRHLFAMFAKFPALKDNDEAQRDFLTDTLRLGHAIAEDERLTSRAALTEAQAQLAVRRLDAWEQGNTAAAWTPFGGDA